MSRPSKSEAIFLDFETLATPEYNLNKLKPRAYIQDSRFDVLMLAVAVGDGPIQVFHKLATAGGTLDAGIALVSRELAAGKTLVAHNVGFDGLILQLKYGLSATHICDTQDLASYLRIRPKLENLARHIGQRKAAAPPFEEASLRDPSTLQQMARYCAVDVKIARHAFEVAIGDGDIPDAEFDVIDLTARMNLSGLRIDSDRLAQVMASLVDAKNTLLEQIASKHSFDTGSLGSHHAIKKFAKEQFGVDLPSIAKKNSVLVDACRANEGLGEFIGARRLFGELRKQVTQLAKLTEIGGRIYLPIRYYGSHTGRFSGGGRDRTEINLQSLPKTKDVPHPSIALIRTILVPSAGRHFVAADLSTIEARVTATLAGEQGILQLLRQGRDLYIWFGEQIFPGKTIVKDGENNHLRKLCKEAFLALGFGMGYATFERRVRNVVPSVVSEDIKLVFESFRTRFPAIRRLLNTYWRAFYGAAEDGTVARVGRCVFSRTVGAAGRTVCVKIPTGRVLYYRSVEITDGEDGYKNVWYSPAFEYEVSAGTSRRSKPAAATRKFDDGRIRELLIGPTIIENIVQAVARDIMVHQMLAAQKTGLLQPVFHVHDELVCECTPCRCPPPSPGSRRHLEDCEWCRAARELLRIMSIVPATLPEVADVPVGAELSTGVRASYGG